MKVTVSTTTIAQNIDNEYNDHNNDYKYDYDFIQEETSNAVASMTQGSMFFALNPPQHVPLFGVDEVETGKVLGEGQFCTVREVTTISSTKQGRQDLNSLVHSMTKIGFMNMTTTTMTNDDHNCTTTTSTVVTDSPTVSQITSISSSDTVSSDTTTTSSTNNDHDNDHSTTTQGNNNTIFVDMIAEKRIKLRDKSWRHPNSAKTRYAVKQVRCDLVNKNDNNELLTGVIDIAREAKLLSSLQHPNIIKLRGTIGIAGHPQFMLLLDRLHITLDDKLKIWKNELRGLQWFQIPFFSRQNQYEVQELFMDRLMTLFDVARVFKHLHHHNIIYRDLKPDNVGYDVRDELRIFDFGLAREVNKDCFIPGGSKDDYLLTGVTGSRRWMAPEVYLNEPYGLSADVYSFGLLFWNVISLKTPFGKTNLNKHYNDVIIGNKRPPRINNHNDLLSSTLQQLMEQCWDANKCNRPCFEDICSTIQNEMNELYYKQQNDTGHSGGMFLTITNNRTWHLDSKSEYST